MEIIKTTDIKTYCIKAECDSEEFIEIRDSNDLVSPAKKCAKCGTVSMMFRSKL